MYQKLYYDIFPESKGHLRDLKVQLHYLSTCWDVLDVADRSGHFDARVFKEVPSFLNRPSEWSAAHGGIAVIDAGPQSAKEEKSSKRLRAS